MHTRTRTFSLLLMVLGTGAWSQSWVVQSPRQVPVAYSVDVLVVGASTGAVAAAVEAARQGASVFLAAPHQYLGDDMTATLRLWLEPGEVPEDPLARALFESSTASSPSCDALPFSYSADAPSNARHPDTAPPSLLGDGVWGDPTRESVQYDADVTVTADLGASKPVRGVRLAAYRGKDYGAQDVTVSVSDDGVAWRTLGATAEAGEEPSELTGAQIQLFVLHAEAQARYVRLVVRRSAALPRLLLGEIEVLGPSNPDATQSPYPLPTPMHVKRTLDAALLSAGVQYLYSCYPSDVLVDAAGAPCGIVMANRAGRQAVVARTIIDATDRATVVRLAGGRFRDYPAGAHTFHRVVLGGEPREAPGLSHRLIAPAYRGQFPNAARTSSGAFKVIDYTLVAPMKDASWASWARVDQQARALTYHPEQQFTSDVLFEVPPDPVFARATAEGPWVSAEALPLEAFRPAGLRHLFLLGGCADLSRAQAESLLRPLNLIALGKRIGQAAAQEARALPLPASPQVLAHPIEAQAMGEVREALVGVRPTQNLPTIPAPRTALPVLGTYDVVVVGGGTAGAPAGIAAARQGARTLVVEYLSGLGGIGTLGAIPSYCAGNRTGFAATVQAEAGTVSTWVIEQRMEWWRKQLELAGADVWFGTIGCGALVEDGTVKGAVVATPFGRGVVLARTVIDATGNADLAFAAGAECLCTDADEFGMQGTGLPPRKLGGNLVNTDYTLADDSDLVDTWHLFVYARDKFQAAFDLGQLIGTRERRRVRGDFVMSYLDQFAGRTYPDTVVQARGGGYDTHGYMIDRFLSLDAPRTAGLNVNIPYRSMLPRGLDGMLVVGLGISAHRDAVPLIRMQPDIENGGYATGVAAAMAAKAGGTVRGINVRELQRHLVALGNLTPSVLVEQDSFPLPAESLAEAVRELPRSMTAAAVVFAHSEQARRGLQQAFAEAEGADRLTYATVLAMLGDGSGVDDLLQAVASQEWDKGWDFHGLVGEAKQSALDTHVMALGWAGDRKAMPVLLEKLSQLTASSEFSHFRAVALALEMLGDPRAARPLAQALALPGVSGHVEATIEDARRLEIAEATSTVTSRVKSLRELLLARALYRCGDFEARGETTLRCYTTDLRGHLARHAKAVLEEGSPSQPQTTRP